MHENLRFAGNYNIGGSRPYQFTTDELIEFVNQIEKELKIKIEKLERELYISRASANISASIAAAQNRG